ncbi:MAG: hypothetical protein ACXABY_35440, partial [Candidatus Thorarchaeota archaeon]
TLPESSVGAAPQPDVTEPETVTNSPDLRRNVGLALVTDPFLGGDKTKILGSLQNRKDAGELTDDEYEALVKEVEDLIPDRSNEPIVESADQALAKAEEKMTQLPERKSFEEVMASKIFDKSTYVNERVRLTQMSAYLRLAKEAYLADSSDRNRNTLEKRLAELLERIQ